THVHLWVKGILWASGRFFCGRKTAPGRVSTGGLGGLGSFRKNREASQSLPCDYVGGSGSPPLRVMIHRYTFASIPSLIPSTWASPKTWFTIPPAWLLLGPHKRPTPAALVVRSGSTQAAAGRQIAVGLAELGP